MLWLAPWYLDTTLQAKKGDEFPPLFHAFSNSFILDCNSLLIQLPITLNKEQNAIQLLLVISQIQFPGRVVDMPVVKSVSPKV